MLDDLLEGDAGPLGGANGALGPGGVDQLVALAGVVADLLETAGAGALEGDDVGLAREERFVLQVGQGETLRVVDQAADVEEEF